MFHLNHFTILLFVHSLKFGMSNLLMISITSGPTNIRLRDAIRSSWVQLCRQSPVCDHRFFLDTPKVTRDLEEESDKHGDMVTPLQEFSLTGVNCVLFPTGFQKRMRSDDKAS